MEYNTQTYYDCFFIVTCTKTSKEGSMGMLLEAFDTPEEPRKLYSWQHEVGDTKPTGYPKVCILFCTEVTTVMKGEQIMDEYSMVSLSK